MIKTTKSKIFLIEGNYYIEIDYPKNPGMFSRMVVDAYSKKVVKLNDLIVCLYYLIFTDGVITPFTAWFRLLKYYKYNMFTVLYLLSQLHKIVGELK